MLFRYTYIKESRWIFNLRHDYAIHGDYDAFVDCLEKTLYAPDDEKIKAIKSRLQKLYTSNLAKYAKTNVAALIRRSATNNTDIVDTIRNYFVKVDEETVKEIEKMVKGG